MRFSLSLIFAIISLVPTMSSWAQNTTIEIDASREIHPVSQFLTGACIEDVNHEIYGGLYSQMIFGESFQEPPTTAPLDGFTSYGGKWVVTKGILQSSSGEGTKLVAESPQLMDGEVSVDLQFNGSATGNAGVILRVSKPNIGADRFFGYEVSLDPERQVLRLGRHRNDWQLIQDVRCEIEIGKWVNLRVSFNGNQIEVLVNDVSKLTYKDSDKTLLREGQIGLRQWQRSASFKSLTVKTKSKTTNLPFVEKTKDVNHAISSMWQPIRKGTAIAEYEIAPRDPFVGTQSQRLRFLEGQGEIGINNKGLNRWGLYFQKANEYEGVLYAKADSPCELWVGAENKDGSLIDEKKLEISTKEWTRLEFSLKPQETVRDGQFTLKLKKPGAVTIGYVFLQPGPWGRYKDLPVRRDVAEMLVNQGITVMRYGGSMINNSQYKWKNMIGPRSMRPPYQGHWYPYSTNGWGILDFMNFCESAGFEYVPAFSMSETPEDMADFIRYAKGDADTEWGKKRVADGHPAPYRLKYLQLGNEERVDEKYADQFIERAEAIWSVDKDIILVVGDFVYDDLIKDPSRITGAASKITSLDGQRKILQFAKRTKQEVWFDVHVWTGGPRPNRSFDAMFTFIDALQSISDGAKFKVVTFELNANNHDHRRAIANALAINAIERDGRLPMATSANCLQPDGQNDNGWDQGLVFLSPSRVWMQSPGYVTQIYSKNYCPRLVECKVDKNEKDLDCNAKLTKDGKTLVLNVINLSSRQKTSEIRIKGFDLIKEVAELTELSGNLDAVNTETNPSQIVPRNRKWNHTLATGKAEFIFAANSLTTIVLK